MGRPNVHKAPGCSQLSKTDTGSLQRNGMTRTRLVRRPHTARHDAPDRTMPHGRKWQTRRPNLHKAPRRSQLSKNLYRHPRKKWLDPNMPGRATSHGSPDRTMPQGAKRKQATRTCTRHSGSHNLAKLIWVPSKKMGRPERTQSGDLTRHDTAHPTE